MLHCIVGGMKCFIEVFAAEKIVHGSLQQLEFPKAGSSVSSLTYNSSLMQQLQRDESLLALDIYPLDLYIRTSHHKLPEGRWPLINFVDYLLSGKSSSSHFPEISSSYFPVYAQTISVFSSGVQTREELSLYIQSVENQLVKEGELISIWVFKSVFSAGSEWLGWSHPKELAFPAHLSLYLVKPSSFSAVLMQICCSFFLRELKKMRWWPRMVHINSLSSLQSRQGWQSPNVKNRNIIIHINGYIVLRVF